MTNPGNKIMTKRNLFSDEEIALCTYAAIYDAKDFGGIGEIHKITLRKVGSIVMKIRNIAAMLDEKRVPRYNTVSPLTGLPPGKKGRTTNWDIVKDLYPLEKNVFLTKCKSIIKK